jgi:hypothetical protein
MIVIVTVIGLDCNAWVCMGKCVVKSHIGQPLIGEKCREIARIIHYTGYKQAAMTQNSITALR